LSLRLGGTSRAALVAVALWAFGLAACAGDDRSQAGQVPTRGGAQAPAGEEDQGRKTVSAYGMQAWLGTQLRGPDFRLLRDSGAGLFRFNLLTTSRDDRGPPAIPTYDAVIQAAVEQRVELLPVLMRTRPKDRSPAEQVAAPPEGRAQHAEWRRRVRLLAERYGPRGSFWRERPRLPYRPIRMWEVWNEPNLPQFWDYRPTNPSEYGRLLRETREVLRSVDRGARIISGGLASRHSGGPYLGAALDAAGPCSVDAISIHPYAPTVERAMGHLAEARSVADSRGLRDVALWTTEIGWRVGEGGAGDLELGYSEVETPAAQARALDGFFAATTRRRRELRLGPTFAFALRDRVNPKTGEVDNKSGLRLANDTPRPAWGVLSRWARAAPPLRWPRPRACPR